MAHPAETPEVRSFGPFEFDFRTRELRKRGVKIKLLGQPLEILAKLLERSGEVVTRKELCDVLWPSGVFVDFEHSLNAAVKRLRRALDDPADEPRFIETLSRLGYRFIGPVDMAGGEADDSAINSLAVLPFENPGADPDTEYLSDGITDSIITSLSRLPKVRVMARSTVFRYKHRNADPRTVGRKLNVQAVLTGTVRQRGAAIVIGTELVEVRNGWQLWGEQYNRKFADILAIEEEISREIVGTLRLKLNRDEQKQLSRRDTRNTEAYQDYLKGRYHWNRMTQEGLEKAIACFQQAIAKDPEYALAYVGLADCWSLVGFFGLMPPKVVMPKAKEAAMKALEIDDGIAEAHATLAGLKKVYDWDWRGAEIGFRRSLDLNPHYEMAHRWYADYLAALGRMEEALTEMQRAQELDPLSLIISMELAWIFYMARQFDRAIRQARKTLEMEPTFASANYVLGLAQEQSGHYDQALEALQESCASSKNNPASLGSLGHVLAMAGRTCEAIAVRTELERLARRSYVSPYWCAIVHAALGEKALAFECLERAHDERDVWLAWLKVDPRLDRLRPEAQFQSLLHRVGL